MLEPPRLIPHTCIYMKKWPHFSELFAIHPFSEDEHAPAGTQEDVRQYAHRQKTRFDNTVRVWIAGPTFVACYILWVQHVIVSLWPITILFGVYALLQFGLNWHFYDSRHYRLSDFTLSGLDTVGMSLSIYFTGAGDSPLYFLYFIPLIVHAFHRDSAVVMFSGLTGVSLYAVTILYSLDKINGVLLTNLLARLFFMLLTVAIACLAIAVLKRKDAHHQRQIARLDSQTRLSEMLNQVVVLNDVEEVKSSLAALISSGLGQEIRLEVRLDVGRPSKPAEQTNEPEHSGVCIPVGGSENELFGELCVRCFVSHAFHRDELSFLRFVARSLGLAIQRVLRMEELRRSLEMNSCVMAATIASVRSIDDTYKAVTEGMRTVLNVEQAELLIWSDAFEAYRSVHRVGTFTSPALQTTFQLKTLRGKNLGELRVERAASSADFHPTSMEIAATFAARAALAIENAHAHRRERHDNGEQAA